MNAVTKRPEPLLNRALIISLVAALLTLLEAFGVPLTPDQQQAINQFLAVLAPIIVALLARWHVTPNAIPKDVQGYPLVREEWK